VLIFTQKYKVYIPDAHRHAGINATHKDYHNEKWNKRQRPLAFDKSGRAHYHARQIASSANLSLFSYANQHFVSELAQARASHRRPSALIQKVTVCQLQRCHRCQNHIICRRSLCLLGKYLFSRK
jgi:hypothetical protein